jgi:LmbE family N-acetylglucosaminyl deacetylase
MGGALVSSGGKVKSTLLAVFAHPDDESFGVGGTLAKYASNGTHVVLVCATRGEVGEISDASLATPESLGHVREYELRCAAQTLGISELIFLDYLDSGMEGTPENMHPKAFIQAPPHEVVGKLVRVIRELQPQVVITFDPGGGYGHPDHIAISRYTTQACSQASSSTDFPEAGPPWQPNRLFYNAIPSSFFVEMRKKMQALRMDTSQLDGFDPQRHGFSDDQIKTRIDVTRFVEVKWNALQCHQTQFGPDNLLRLLPEVDLRQMISFEYFALASPTSENGLQEMDDLFSGMRL